MLLCILWCHDCSWRGSPVFLAQAVGMDLSWEQQLVMVGVMMLTSKGTAGIAALALIVGIDRLLNEGRVFINVLGNVMAAVVVGKWEKHYDPEQAREALRASGQKKKEIESKTQTVVEADKVDVH